MAIPSISAYNTNGFPRPGDDIDPKLKQNDPDYSLRYCQFIYNQYLRGSTFIKEADIETIKRNRLYAAGRQSPEVYKSKFLSMAGGKNNEDGPTYPVVSTTTGNVSMKEKREGWVNMNFEDIFSPLPKYIQNIIGIMEEQEHDIAITAIDENSGSAREELKMMFFVKEHLNETLVKFDKVFNIPEVDNNMPTPKSIQEIEMLSKMGLFKLPHEIAMKKCMRDADYQSNMKKIKRMVIRDLITIGKSATMTYIDPITNRVKSKWIDLPNLIIEDTVEEDGSDATYWGVVEYYNVQDLRAETGWSEEKVQKIVSKWSGRIDNPDLQPLKDNVQEVSAVSYETFKIPILHCWWIANDSTYTQTRKTDDGKEISIDEPYRDGGKKPPRIRNNEKRTTEKTTVKTLYSAKWVMDMEDMVFSYGKDHNIPYDYSTKDVSRPIHLYRLGVKPIMEHMITIEDQIMFTYLRFQNAILKAPPPGLAIEVGSLTGLKVGNALWKPLDSLTFYSHTGNLLYKLQPTEVLGGGTNAGKPFDELKGGLGTSIDDTVRTLEMLYRQLDILSGIDPISSVSKSPTSKQGKAVTQIAVAATGNTLKPIYSGYLSMREGMYRTGTCMIQSIISGYDKDNINNNPYSRIVGPGYSLAILIAMDHPPAEYGYIMEAKPTEQIMNDVRQAAQLAMTKGVIGYSDYLFLIDNLNTDDGIKYARMFISHREAMYKEAENKARLEHAKAQNEGMIQAEQLKAQNEMSKIKAEEQKEINIIKAKGVEQRKTLLLQLKLQGIEAEDEFEREQELQESAMAEKETIPSGG